MTNKPLTNSLESMITDLEAARLPVFETIQQLTQARDILTAQLEDLDERHSALSRCIAELRTQKRIIENQDLRNG